jgi:glycosyltransferase involved in cell wall biosynthesis
MQRARLHHAPPDPGERPGLHDKPLEILVLTGHPPNTVPGQRFRFEQHVHKLACQGINLHIRSFLPSDLMPSLYAKGHYGRKVRAVCDGAVQRLRQLVSADSYDAVLIHKGAAPLGYPVVERALALRKVPYVFDFDDAIYLSHSSDANRMIAPLKFSGKAAIIARHATLVVAGNSHLASWALNYNLNVRVIPTTIDTEVYRPCGARQSDAAVCIGWSGSTTTSRFLDPLAPVLAQLQRDAGVRLKVIGAPGYTFAGAHIEAQPWCHETEVADLCEIDIGVMPLPDTEWARGKCGLKALQYMALGIPTVMSPVGVNATIAEDGAAVLAESQEEWRTALWRLIRDPAERAELGRRGRRRVESAYSANVARPLWADALRAAAARRERGQAHVG